MTPDELKNESTEAIRAKLAREEEETAKEKTGIPLFITKKLRLDLEALGVSSEEISQMKPEEAWKLFEQKTSEVKPTEESPKVVSPAAQKQKSTLNSSNNWGEIPIGKKRKKAETPDIITGVVAPEANTQPSEEQTQNPKPEPQEAENERVPEPKEKKTAEQELKELPKADREKLGFGLARIGFSVEQHKNEFFASTFNWLAKTNLKQNRPVTEFFKELGDKFDRQAQEAHTKAKNIKEDKGGKILKAKSFASLGGTVAKYGRIVADIAHTSISSPLRYVMLAGMAVEGGAEAAKNVRLKTISDQVRLDAQTAEDEAWKIYEATQKKEGKGADENVSAEVLKQAYLRDLPADIQKKLQNPSVANATMQGLFRKQLGARMGRLNKKVEAIEGNAKLSPEKREQKINKLFASWEKELRDYDRAITQAGTIDELAMWTKNIQTAGKAVVVGMQIETVAVSFWHIVSNAMAAHEAVGKAIEQHTGNAGAADAVKTIHPVEAKGAASHLQEKISEKILTQAHEFVGPKVPDALKVNLDALAGHPLTHAADFTIGHNPAAIEHTWEKIILNHMSLHTLPDGTVLDQDTAARVLNTTANMMREDLKGIVEIKNGHFMVLDPEKLNLKLDARIAHAADLSKLGAFKDPNSALGYIKNVKWLDKIHATGLHDTAAGADTGIPGHPDVTADQIGKFDDIPSPTSVSAALAQEHISGVDVDARFNEASEHLSKLGAPMETVEYTGPTLHHGIDHLMHQDAKIRLDPLHDVLKSNVAETAAAKGSEHAAESITWGHGEHIAPRAPHTFDPTHDDRPDGYNYTFDTGRNRGMFQNMLSEQVNVGASRQAAESVFRHNLETIFPQDTESVWEDIGEKSVTEVWSTAPEVAQKEGFAHMIAYLSRLREVTGLEPKGKIFMMRGAESTADYVRRAVKWAASNNKLEDITMHIGAK